MKPSGNQTNETRSSAVGVDARFLPVHGDMTAIFAGVSPDQAASPTGRATGPRPDRARSRRVVAIGVAAVLLLAGVLAIFAWSRRHPTAVEVATPARVVRAPSVTPEARPPAAESVTEVEPAAVAVAAPAPVPPPVAPVEVTRPRARITAKAIATDPGRKPATTREQVVRASPGSATEARAPYPEVVAMPDCSASDAWCLRGATSAADRDLRNAYGAAVQSKVDGATLKRIQREWVRYRRLANKDPKELIRGYSQLTVDLRRSASQKMHVDGIERPR